MAKNTDFNVVDGPSGASVVVNPTPKIGILIRYRAGRKAEAIDLAFEQCGSDQGIVALVPDGGQSRKWASPDTFPVDNAFVPGTPTKLFVKYECVD